MGLNVNRLWGRRREVVEEHGEKWEYKSNQTWCKKWNYNLYCLTNSDKQSLFLFFQLKEVMSVCPGPISDTIMQRSGSISCRSTLHCVQDPFIGERLWKICLTFPDKHSCIIVWIYWNTIAFEMCSWSKCGYWLDQGLYSYITQFYFNYYIILGRHHSDNFAWLLIIFALFLCYKITTLNLFYLLFITMTLWTYSISGTFKDCGAYLQSINPCKF